MHPQILSLYQKRLQSVQRIIDEYSQKGFYTESNMFETYEAGHMSVQQEGSVEEEDGKEISALEQ